MQFKRKISEQNEEINRINDFNQEQIKIKEKKLNEMEKLHQDKILNFK